MWKSSSCYVKSAIQFIFVAVMQMVILFNVLSSMSCSLFVVCLNLALFNGVFYRILQWFNGIFWLDCLVQVHVLYQLLSVTLCLRSSYLVHYMHKACILSLPVISKECQ